MKLDFIFLQELFISRMQPNLSLGGSTWEKFDPSMKERLWWFQKSNLAKRQCFVILTRKGGAGARY